MQFRLSLQFPNFVTLTAYHRPTDIHSFISHHECMFIWLESHKFDLRASSSLFFHGLLNCCQTLLEFFHGLREDMLIVVDWPQLKGWKSSVFKVLSKEVASDSEQKTRKHGQAMVVGKGRADNVICLENLPHWFKKIFLSTKSYHSGTSYHWTTVQPKMHLTTPPWLDKHMMETWGAKHGISKANHVFFRYPNLQTISNNWAFHAKS